MSQTVAMVSLGCAKNLVNSEQMLWLLQEAGFSVRPDADGADAVVVNTCGFIESAKQEAIDHILELAALKADGKLKKIVVAGCLAERYREEILTELPEVDGIVGCGGFEEIVSAVRAALEGETPVLFGDIDAPVSGTKRILGTPPYTAYLKVAEGCDNHCAYCVIPSLRGVFRSRPMEALLEEAQTLLAGGAREIIVVAQDTTRYGLDLYGTRKLPELLTALCGLEGLHWLRLHYFYPDEVTPELIEVIAREGKILKYLDIPIQHASDRLLTSMNRRGAKASLLKLVKTLRENIPGVVLRTSVIVGLPGEDEAAFEELCDFLRETRWERAGVFPYSAEEGTQAAEMPAQVPEPVRQRRAEIVRELQQDIMDEYNARLVGQPLEVLCEGYDRAAGCYYGRSYADSPEIDGKVFFTSKTKHAPGEFVTVTVTEPLDGDLVGEI